MDEFKPKTSAASLYTKGEAAREPFLRRGRDAAMLTIPALLPEFEEQEEDDYALPFQSVGADGVNNLSASLLLTLLPPNEPFFRFVVTPEGEEVLAEELAGQPPEKVQEVKSQIEAQLSVLEQQVIRRIEKERLRPGLGEALKQLLAVGNTVIDYGDDKDDSIRVFRLDQYVVERLGNGEVFRIIIREEVLVETLTDEERVLANASSSSVFDTGSANTADDSTVHLYTVVQRTNPRRKGEAEYAMWQELGDIMVPGTYKTYTANKVPIHAYWFSRNYGKNYSLSYVDQYVGDLKSLEGLSEAQVEAAAAAARLLVMVDPAGMTNKQDVEKAPNLGVIAGRLKDVAMLQANKLSDFRVVSEVANKIEDRLNRAFLITEGVIRDAERVTAEEIRLLRQSIESKLGNVYAMMTEEVQEPQLDRIIAQMEEDGEMPDLPNGVEYMIVAGVDSLGKAQAMDRHMNFLGAARELIGPDQLAVYLNPSELLRRLATFTRVQPVGLINSEEAVKATQERQQQLAMAEKLGPGMIREGGNLLQNQQEQPAAESAV